MQNRYKNLFPATLVVSVGLMLLGLTLEEPLDIVNIFDMSEVSEIATEVMKLSGVIGAKSVTVVQDLKN